MHSNFTLPDYPLNHWVTYVLQLESGKYYVGRATNGTINTRLSKHLNKACISGWTHKYKPISVIDVLPGDVEEKLTLEYRTKFGKENVRGYVWVSCDDPDLACYVPTKPEVLDSETVAKLFC